MEDLGSFKVLDTYNIERSGTSSKYSQIVQCPRCNAKFHRLVKDGCFNSTEKPAICPKCCYPFQDYRKKPMVLGTIGQHMGQWTEGHKLILPGTARMEVVESWLA